LVTHCTALRDLTLEVDSYELSEDPAFDSDSDSSDSNTGPFPASTRKAVHMIQRGYPIWPVIRCPALRSFTLVCRSDDYHLEQLERPYSAEELFEPLVDWLREQLALRAPNVAFEVAYLEEVKRRRLIGFQKQYAYEVVRRLVVFEGAGRCLSNAKSDIITEAHEMYCGRSIK
jgi:hypothetical protein